MQAGEKESDEDLTAFMADLQSKMEQEVIFAY